MAVGNQPLGTGVTGLTLDLLAERIESEQKVREAHEQTEQRIRESHEEAAAQALQTATQALERRLEGMNEFRAQLTEQNRTFISQAVFDSRMEAMNARLTLLERTGERSAGADAERQRSADSRARLYALTAAIAGIASGIILHFIQ
jgi:hypothetical protein